MTTQRLEVRLDPEHQRRLRDLAALRNIPVSETVRRLIDEAYDAGLNARRLQAALALGQMEIEDVPDPATLSKQLEQTYDPGLS